jgi:hypothetical protein
MRMSMPGWPRRKSARRGISQKLAKAWGRGQRHGRFPAPAQLGSRRTQFGKGRLGCPPQALTGRSQRQGADLALEQAGSQRRLQGNHLLADRRLRDEEFLRRAREAQLTRRGIEGAQGFERRQVALTHSNSSCISGLDIAGRARPAGQ